MIQPTLFMVLPHLLDGSLVEVLPDCNPKPKPISIVSAQPAFVAEGARVRRLDRGGVRVDAVAGRWGELARAGGATRRRRARGWRRRSGWRVAGHRGCCCAQPTCVGASPLPADDVRVFAQCRALSSRSRRIPRAPSRRPRMERQRVQQVRSASQGVACLSGFHRKLTHVTRCGLSSNGFLDGVNFSTPPYETCAQNRFVVQDTPAGCRRIGRLEFVIPVVRLSECGEFDVA